MHRITIERLANGDSTDSTDHVKLYEQTVTEIDLPKIIDAINTPPKVKRVRRKRGAAVAEAGKL